MTPQEHYERAEELLTHTVRDVAAIQAHATLALAGFTRDANAQKDPDIEYAQAVARRTPRFT